MTDEEVQPAWVTWIRQDIQAVNARIDRLVTVDSFRQEQGRVNEKFDVLGREMGQLRGSIQAEATARATEQTLALKQAAADKDKLLATERATKWQWFLLIAGPLATWFIANLVSSVGGP